MKIENAVKRHNEGEHNDEIAQALREFSQGYPVWREGQPLDLDRARKVLAHCKSGGTAPQGYLTTDALLGAAAPKVELDPSADGVDLFLGESTDSAAVDWSAVDPLRRQLVLHARDTGMMDHQPGPAMRRQWAAELHKDKGLTSDWQRVLDSYGKLKASRKEALEQRLHKQPATSTPEPRRMEDLEPAALGGKPQIGGVYIGGNVHGSVMVSGNGNTVSSTPSPNGGVPILIMYSREDTGFAQALIRSMAIHQRNGTVELIDWHRTPAGVPLRSAQAAMLARAKIVAVLVTADALADPDLMPTLEARASGVVVMPILCQASMWKMSSIGKMVAFPRNERPVGTPGNHEAWFEISQALMQAAKLV